MYSTDRLILQRYQYEASSKKRGRLPIQESYFSRTRVIDWTDLVLSNFHRHLRRRRHLRRHLRRHHRLRLKLVAVAVRLLHFHRLVVEEPHIDLSEDLVLEGVCKVEVVRYQDPLHLLVELLLFHLLVELLHLLMLQMVTPLHPPHRSFLLVELLKPPASRLAPLYPLQLLTLH
jgi:hypothetical protein